MSLPRGLEDSFHEYGWDAQRMAHCLEELGRYGEGAVGLGGGAGIVEYQANAMSVTSYLGALLIGRLHSLFGFPAWVDVFVTFPALSQLV